MGTGGRSGGEGGSVITSPVVTGAPTTITSKALVTLQQVRFTAASITDPQTLYRVLYDMQRFVAQAIRPLAQNPLLFGNVVGPFTFAGGDTQYISHRLGRAYQGFVVVDAQTNTWIGYRTTLPAGVTASQMIAIHSNNPGTYTFLIW
jgi:hypothetical protein